MRLVLVFPNLTAGEVVGLAEGQPDASCAAEQTCPLYLLPRLPSPRQNYHNQNYGLTEIYYRSTF